MAFLWLVLLLGTGVPAAAHGGSVWMDEDDGPFHLIVQTQPTLIDKQLKFTVLVSRPDYGPMLPDAVVQLQGILSGSAPVALAPPPEPGQDGYYDLPVTLPDYGNWAFTITVKRGAELGVGHFNLLFQPPSGAGPPLWLLALVPALLAAAIFIYYWRVPKKRLEPSAAPEPYEHEDRGDDQGGDHQPEGDWAIIGDKLDEVHAAEAHDKR